MSVNPAFLTFSEYLDVINPNRIHHSSSAYQVSVENLNSYQKPEKFSKLLQQFSSHGRNFLLKEEIVDRWAMNYTKINDDGSIPRDENGMALMLNREEIEEKVSPRYQNEHAIIDRLTGKVVACTADEWGCLLIQVAEEYQGLGLGSKLSACHRERYPDRHSGGMTSGGEQCCYHAYQTMVAKHLTQGKYREALMDGDVSLNRIVDILKSARVGGKYVAREKAVLAEAGGNPDIIKRYQWGRRDEGFSLDMTNTSDLLLYANDSVAILYSRHLYAVMDRQDSEIHENLDHFINEGIAGYAYVGGVYDAKSIPKLFRLYGQNDNIKSLLTEVMMNTNLGEPVRLLEDQKALLERRVKDDVELTPVPRSPFHVAQMDTPTMEWLADAQKIEAMHRKALDNQYGEKWMRIEELACGVAESAYEKELDQEPAENDLRP